MRRMRLCTFRDATGPRLGRVDGDRVQPLAGADVSAALGGAAPADDGDPLPLEGLELLPPLVPGKIIGIGLNYRDHAAETGAQLPTRPLLFAKLPTSVAGPAADIVVPSYTDELDYEGELAVVVGRRALDVSEADALRHVFGYAVMDDVSARDRQREEPQWIRAKGGDTMAPWGPWITTADEVPDPRALRLVTTVNGEVRQDSSTSDLIFGPQELVDFLAETITLEPGDIILTGTPAGVGTYFDPPKLLNDGDVVRIEIEGLGAIEHPIQIPG
jgi:acylpyruvate hydrolase